MSIIRTFHRYEPIFTSCQFCERNVMVRFPVEKNIPVEKGPNFFEEESETFMVCAQCYQQELDIRKSREESR